MRILTGVWGGTPEGGGFKTGSKGKKQEDEIGNRGMEKSETESVGRAQLLLDNESIFHEKRDAHGGRIMCIADTPQSVDEDNTGFAGCTFLK